MANHLMIALALALVTVSVRADNCGMAGPQYSMKATLANQYCMPGADVATCTPNDCGCSQCCEVEAGTCEALYNAGTACGTDRAYNAVQGSASIRGSAATTSNYDSICCVDKPTCASHTCAAGMKKKSSIDDFKCTPVFSQDSTVVCRDDDCCEADNTKCYGLASFSIGGGCMSATGCSSCPSGKSYVCPSDRSLCPSNGLALAGPTSTTTFEDLCCNAVATCSAHSCAAWEVKKNGTTDNTPCLTWQTDAASCGAACCEDDTTKCKGAKMHLGVVGTANQCAASEFEDPAKYSRTVSAAADWKGLCCTAMTTCQSFKDHNYSPAASGADKMQKPEHVLFLAITGLLAMAK